MVLHKSFCTGLQNRRTERGSAVWQGVTEKYLYGGVNAGVGGQEGNVWLSPAGQPLGSGPFDRSGPDGAVPAPASEPVDSSPPGNSWYSMPVDSISLCLRSRKE